MCDFEAAAWVILKEHEGTARGGVISYICRCIDWIVWLGAWEANNKILLQRLHAFH